MGGEVTAAANPRADQELRQLALMHAANTGSEMDVKDGSSVLERAQSYYEFLKGGQ